MKKRIIVGVVLLFVLAFTAACGQDTEITGKVVDVEKYGHVVLDITTEEFGQAGFELGDIVTVNAGTYTGDVPCLNGCYVDKGEYMVRIPDNHPNITVCINYGDFSEETGTGIGDTVTITMKEKAGARTTSSATTWSATRIITGSSPARISSIRLPRKT